MAFSVFQPPSFLRGANVPAAQPLQQALAAARQRFANPQDFSNNPFRVSAAGTPGGLAGLPGGGGQDLPTAIAQAFGGQGIVPSGPGLHAFASKTPRFSALEQLLEQSQARSRFDRGLQFLAPGRP